MGGTGEQRFCNSVGSVAEGDDTGGPGPMRFRGSDRFRAVSVSLLSCGSFVSPAGLPLPDVNGRFVLAGVRAGLQPVGYAPHLDAFPY